MTTSVLTVLHRRVPGLGTLYVIDALDEASKRYDIFDRGIFHPLYTQDNNDLIIELSANKHDVPDDRQAEVLILLAVRPWR